MTEQEIRDKAPSGATHVDDLNEFLKFEDGEWYGLSYKGNWCKIIQLNKAYAEKYNLKPL